MIKIYQIALLIILTAMPYMHCIGNEHPSSKFNTLNSSNLGVKAVEPILDQLMDSFLEPPISKTGKSLLTINKMGFDILNNSKSQNNWVIAEFDSLLHKKTGMVLDIGCGYGHIALTALAKKNTVIANDIAVEHLIEVRRRAIANKLEIANLYLNNRSFPYELELSNESLHVVMLHRVLHFLSPEEIEDGLEKIHKWLKHDGKLFIVVMAPQHKSFSQWFLPIYNREWENGNKWPGVNLLTEKALPEQAYNLPKYLHVMDERPLRYALEKHGFKIEKIDFVDMKHFGKIEENRDGNEAIGVVATKI